MNSSQLKNKVIYVIRTDLEHGLNLVIGNNSHSKEGKIIDQTLSTESHVVFEGHQKVSINLTHLLLKLEIKCLEEGNKYLIPQQEYRQMIKEINNLENGRENQMRNENSDDEMPQESEENSEEGNHYRVKHFIRQYNEESQNNNDNEHRGRGRPKGSKNKKTIIKEANQLKQPPMELKMALTGLIKRGKGRPKGSKNKVKQYSKQIKIEEGAQSAPFGKRGKGRPKGSKNKIKIANQAMVDEQQENTERKKRGRPPGAKNRANSIESISGERQISQQFIQIELNRPNYEQIDGFYCCKRCQQIKLKKKILMSEANVEESLFKLRNIAQDLGPQNKSNLILTAIRLGDWESLDSLLEIINQIEYYYKPPWKVEKTIDKCRFEIKTKKQFLSKTGKEGNNVLLHDTWKKKQVWWKEITIQRIIESLPRDSLHILEVLFRHSPDLRAQIYNNLTTIIRSGNSSVAEVILRQILFTPSSNRFNFSQEHYELLIGNYPLLNHFKKFNLIKHNDGNNFCSPIHSAAICTNSEFLRKLLQIFTDIINIEDSVFRKPVHYAALCNNNQNLAILFESGADLREYDRKKITPLMLACYEGIYFNVQYILEKVRDFNYINSKSQEGYTAFHYAILKNNLECVELMLNDPYVDIWALTKDQGDLFHLLAGTGNIEILDLILKKQILPYTSLDKFKKTPPMIAIRNHNNDCLVKLLEHGCKLEKADSSFNTLLHYAAAYGNIEAIHILKQNGVIQTKNKRGIYPWEIAIFKGHIGAAKILQSQYLTFDFNEDPLSIALTNIRGTEEYLQCIKYICDTIKSEILYTERTTGNSYMHLICSLSEEQYIKIRKEETNLGQEQIKQEFIWIMKELINYLIDKGLDGFHENNKKQTPLKICIENNNLIGLQKLLTHKIQFDTEPSTGNTILHCLANLACSGLEELKFVEKKLKQCNTNELKSNLRKTDHNGFDFLLFIVKTFTQKAIKNFKKMIKYQHIFIRAKEEQKKSKILNKNSEIDIQSKCFQDFTKFEDRFLKLIQFILDMGCDINNQVTDKKNQSSQLYKKWGIQHFLMQFPSLKLIKFFKPKMRDFNSQNNNGMTPLHLFCKNIKRGNILEANIQLPNDYDSQFILEYILANGLNPNATDAYRALPVIYAAINAQYQFIVLLRKYKSQLNFCTTKNEIPIIEIIKKNHYFTQQQIEQLLILGMDPNYLDMNKRNSLHHLVLHSSNFDSSPQVCKILLDFSTKINALDKYERSPIFYCFTNMQNTADEQLLQQSQNEKVQILQILMNHKDINLNLFDLYKKTLIHYACEKNHFFSILYLLDKNINIEAKDYQENTPLAICLKHKNLDQAALIISHGVKYGFVHDNNEKLSYFGYAIKNLSVGICFMLLDHGYPIQKALEEVPNSSFKQTLIQKYIR